MVNLSEQSCEACRIDAPKLSEVEINTLMPDLMGWTLLHSPMYQLKKVFSFKDYQGAINFTNNLTKIADEEDHHPKIVLEWGKVTVLWWSHKIEGLHKNDFICASKTDSLYLEK